MHWTGLFIVVKAFHCRLPTSSFMVRLVTIPPLFIHKMEPISLFLTLSALKDGGNLTCSVSQLLQGAHRKASTQWPQWKPGEIICSSKSNCFPYLFPLISGLSFKSAKELQNSLMLSGSSLQVRQHLCQRFKMYTTLTGCLANCSILWVPRQYVPLKDAAKKSTRSGCMKLALWKNGSSTEETKDWLTTTKWEAKGKGKEVWQREGQKKYLA